MTKPSKWIDDSRECCIWWEQHSPLNSLNLLLSSHANMTVSLSDNKG